MSSEIIAFGAVSALGAGALAARAGCAGEPARSAVRHDATLAAAGLRKPFAARVELELPVTDGGDRARSLLARVARDVAQELDALASDWRDRRVGLCLGTSGGGMPALVSCVELLDAGRSLEPELARAAPYFGPLEVIERELDCRFVQRTQLLAACASSVFALGLAHRWLELGLADLVIAGGYDALSPFIAAGFECLGATAERPTPFRRQREGLALGEGAALLALERTGSRPGSSHGRIVGFGASSDAVHVTAPDRAGAGLARAARAALLDAGWPPNAVDMVSAHGTGTSYNDAAESLALATTLGEAAKQVVVQPFKAVIGHTLGAAGVLETLAALDAMNGHVLPAAVGEGEQEPELTARLLDVAETGSASRCLKLASAFGGANAALTLEAARVKGTGPKRRPEREVRLLAVGTPVEVSDPEALRDVVATDPLKLGRMDPLSLLAVSAVAALRGRVALPTSCGVIVGTAAATLEIDAAFERRRRSRGPEPRRFPATSPNLTAGECTIAFSLTGPSHSVGAGPEAAVEALLVAHDWLMAGDAEALLVVAVEQVSDFVAALWQAAGWPRPEAGAVAALLAVEGAGKPVSRPALERARGLAADGLGRLSGARPGWPAFLAALERSVG